LISSVPSHNPTFVSRNFTEAEIKYCRSQPSPPSSFAARWVGKEAVFKSLGVKSKGAAATMKDIEIVNDESGVPTVQLHGEARVSATAKGISKVLISESPFNAPLINEPYSKIFGDFNPIHVNPSPILHLSLLLAMTRGYLQVTSR
jgi:phosphopantetheine--protein transferase-like protein